MSEIPRRPPVRVEQALRILPELEVLAPLRAVLVGASDMRRSGGSASPGVTRPVRWPRATIVTHMKTPASQDADIGPGRSPPSRSLSLGHGLASIVEGQLGDDGIDPALRRLELDRGARPGQLDRHPCVADVLPQPE